MSVTLASSTATRIGQLVWLLGSDRSGEVVAAAGAINRTLAGAGADVHHLAHVAERALQQSPRLTPTGDNIATADIISFCSFPGNPLSESERRFIRHLDARRGRYITEKQRTWLLSIYYRLRSRS